MEDAIVELADGLVLVLRVPEGEVGDFGKLSRFVGDICHDVELLVGH